MSRLRPRAFHGWPRRRQSARLRSYLETEIARLGTHVAELETWVDELLVELAAYRQKLIRASEWRRPRIRRWHSREYFRNSPRPQWAWIKRLEDTPG